MGFSALQISAAPEVMAETVENIREMCLQSWPSADVSYAVDRYELMQLVELAGGFLPEDRLDEEMARMGEVDGLVSFDAVVDWLVEQRRRPLSPPPLPPDGDVMAESPTPAAVMPPMSCPPLLSEMEGLVDMVCAGSVDRLDLSFTYVEAEHCAMLADCLPEAQGLRAVDLRSNGLGDDGINAFTVQLPGSSVVELDLRFNGVGPAGVSLLAKALAMDPTGAMEKVDLRANRVGVDGCEVLARALRRNRSLRYLNLGINTVGDEGAWEIGSALEDNEGLEFLGLDGNDSE